MKPTTLADLEAILVQPDDHYQVEVLPDGSLRAFALDEKPLNPDGKVEMPSVTIAKDGTIQDVTADDACSKG